MSGRSRAGGKVSEWLRKKEKIREKKQTEGEKQKSYLGTKSGQALQV